LGRSQRRIAETGMDIGAGLRARLAAAEDHPDEAATHFQIAIETIRVADDLASCGIRTATK
jgi:hypothetical protein